MRTNLPRPVLFAVIAVGFIILLTVCVVSLLYFLRGRTPAEGSVSGVVTYSEPETLAEDAVVSVKLVDNSASAAVISEQSISSPGQAPIPYDVTYDPNAIDENHSYTMEAQIKDGAGTLLYENKTAYGVITQGNPTTDVNLVVESASASASPSPPQQAPAGSSVSGSVTYRENVALPADAVVFVQLIDVTQADAPAQVVGDQTITNPGQVPIPFIVQYAPAVIDENRIYSIQARITDSSGTVFFRTTTHYPVITQGNPSSDVLVVLEASDSPQAPTSGNVTGFLTYLEKVALPAEAIARVRLVDLTVGNVPEAQIGEQIITSPGQVPIPFDVKYDPAKIDQGHAYTIKATIEDGKGNLLFVTTRNYLVITQGNPSSGVEVILDRLFKG